VTRVVATGKSGMTLVEILVAAAASLMLVAAVAQLYAALGGATSANRNLLRLHAELRAVTALLRTDLAGATAPMHSSLDPHSSAGYFEIIEGPATDAWTDGSHNLGVRKLIEDESTVIAAADCDDVLLFTSRHPTDLFEGAVTSGAGVGTVSVQSPVAELAWFARPVQGTREPAVFSLYRRQRLVLANAQGQPFVGWQPYYEGPNDLSMRVENGGQPNDLRLVPNSLADLSRRDARFQHPSDAEGGTFPYLFTNHIDAPPESGLFFGLASARFGEDVVLTHVLAFDVRVFDPTAPVVATPSGAGAIAPGDVGFRTDLPVLGTGAYVDLGYAMPFSAGSLINGFKPASIPFYFGGRGAVESKLHAADWSANRRTYDTWNSSYDVVPAGSVVPGDLVRGPSTAPYPHQLRGIEVRIRCYEPSSRQVRQVTVRHTFVPH
jgi:hypothetical protein